MALFDKLKSLISDTGKEIPVSEAHTVPARENSVPNNITASRPEAPAAPTGENPGVDNFSFADASIFPPDICGLPEHTLLAAQEEIHARLELLERYKGWQEEQAKRIDKDTDENTDTNSGTDARSGQDTSTAPAPFPRAHAEIRVLISSDRMSAYACCLAPVGDREDISERSFERALADSGIVYGIDRSTLKTIVQEKLYHRLFAIARGTAAADGTDGQVIDHFPRCQELHLQEDVQGNIDYKNVDVFQSIRAGEVICELILPTDGTDGRDVTGKLLPARKGKMPPIPRGKNTSVTEDGSALTSDVDGDISFQSGAFRVESKLIVPGDVDNATGHIHFAGDVIIQGDVRQGFHVDAGGKLTVCGLVEGAALTAGEDIILQKGMHGNGSGSITAKGCVYSTFLEQAKIYAEGDVTSDVIINCNIQSGGSVLAVSGKGILIGGTVKAAESVQAKRIGSPSEVHTVIKIGVSVKKDDNIEEVKKELAAAKETLDKITKNHRYLSGLPEIPEKFAETYRTLGMQKKLYVELVHELQAKIDVLEHQKNDYSKCYVQGNIIYAVTDISLNNHSTHIQDAISMCKVYYSKKDGALALGTF